MFFSVLEYYVCVLHEKSENFKYSFHPLLIFYGKFVTSYFSYFFSQFIPKQT